MQTYVLAGTSEQKASSAPAKISKVLIFAPILRQRGPHSLTQPGWRGVDKDKMKSYSQPCQEGNLSSRQSNGISPSEHISFQYSGLAHC